VLSADGPLPWPRLEPLLAQLIEAARVLHRKGGLLCGLSPDIMRVAAEEDGPRLLISSAGIWQPQDLLATMGDATLRGSTLTDVELHYVAPELLTGQNADVRSDVFTMGVLAYEMATGQLPYTGATMPALLGSMLRGQPADPRERQPTMPAPAAAAIRAALAAAPEARPQTARAFADAIAGK
jgi:serine/threonine-protein kinase